MPINLIGTMANDVALVAWINSHGCPPDSVMNVQYGSRDAATVPPNSVHTQGRLSDGRLVRVDSVSPNRTAPHTLIVTVENPTKKTLEQDAVPLTPGICYLAKLLNAVWQLHIAHAMLWQLGVETAEPPSAFSAARAAFLAQYRHYAQKLGLAVDERTFTALMGLSNWPSAIGRTAFKDLPKRFVFAPGAGVFATDDIDLSTAPEAIRAAVAGREAAALLA